MLKKRLERNEAKRKLLIVSIFLMIFSFAICLVAQAEDQKNLGDSLKNVIEENQALASKNAALQQELEKIRQDQAAIQEQYNQLKSEKDELADSSKRYKDSSQQYSQKIQQLEQSMEELAVAKKQNERKMEDLESELSIYREENEKKSSGDQLSSENTQDVKAREEKTLDLLSKVNAFTEQDETLRKDSAKAHYNMGNIYYQKGEYEIAAREYYQAVTLMPDDPDSHFNLAFVSGEHLKDYRTALKHYQMYLYLKPNAEDAPFVKERILSVQMMLNSIVDSPLEKTDK